MWTVTAGGYTTSDPADIRDFLQQLKDKDDQKPKYADFTDTKIDVDGSKSAYSVDDEGTDVNIPDGRDGGIVKDKTGNWVIQKDNPMYYVSQSAVQIGVDPTSQSSYYEAEKIAYIVSNPAIRAIGLKKNDHAIIEVRDEKGNVIKRVPVIVGDWKKTQDKGSIELSPQAARATALPGQNPYVFDLP